MTSVSSQPIRIALYSRSATEADGALETQEAGLRAAVADMSGPR